MRISRIYTDQGLTQNSNLRLTGQTAHYLSKVLRLKVNAELILFNGDGYEYAAIITSIQKKEIDLEISTASPAASESPLQTILALGISRGERMDLAIQKSTELGVTEIVPLFTEFSEVKLQGERLQKKLKHWQQIAISACEQSGRNSLPVVQSPISLTDWCEQTACELKLILAPDQGKSIAEMETSGQVALLIGPEGGFSEQEIATAVNTGFHPVRLGPRVMRTETAPVAALSCLQLLWGDF